MRPMLYSSTSTMRLSANSLGAWPTAALAVGMLRMLRGREEVAGKLGQVPWHVW